MAQLDASIFMNQQAPDLGKIGEGFERGMRIGDMMRENKIKQAEMQKQSVLKEAFNSGYETGPDGKTVLNPMKVSEFMRGKGMAQDAFKFEQDFKQQQVANLENENKLRSAVFEQTYGDIDFSMKNKGTPQAAKAWESAYDKAERLGYPMAGMSRVYDPNQTDTVYNSMLPMAKQRDLEMQRENNAQKRADTMFDRQLQMGKLDLDRQKIKNEINKGEGLPLDAKKLVDTLATKNANKVSISNQIDSTLNTVEDKTPDQKLDAYRQLIKTMNSSEGADAVGSEEVKRLAGRLEIAFGGLTSGNPGQFGRDLKGFEEQAKTTSDSIKGAVKANQYLIDEKMGRSSGEVKIKKEDMPPGPKEGALKQWDGKTYLHTKGRWVEQ